MQRADIAVSQWKRERPDLDSLPMQVLGRLHGTADRIFKNHIYPLFYAAGLQSGEFDVLATLRRSGAPYALTPTQLYEATMVSSGGMTNRIDRLEQAGFVERKPDPNDRRGKLIYLTAAGKKLMDNLIVKHVANEKQILSALSIAEQKTLDKLLAKLADGLPKVEDNQPS